MPLTKHDLVKDLQALGLKNGDIILVHSSLASIGRVEGGAETVCESLIEACGPGGTVCMPAMGGERPWHVEKSQSGLGIITETFRQRSDTIRSIHPTHSAAACGPKAEELLNEHYKAPTACGEGTPYGRLIEFGGKVILLGCDQDRNTTLHTLEDYADLPYLSTNTPGEFYDETGELRKITLLRYPGPHRDFIGLDRLMRERGVLTIGKVGSAVTRVMDAKGMHDVVLEAMREDPAVVLCDNPHCADCVWQRGKIKEKRLANEEDFILTASTDIMGETIEEIVISCRAEGVKQVEVSSVGGTDVLDLSSAKQKELKEALSKFEISVEAVRSVEAPGEIDSLAEAANRLDAKTVHVPLSEELIQRALDWQGSDLNFLFENRQHTPDECAEQVEPIRGGQGGLAFNPANFAKKGHHPFLNVYYTRRNRLGIRQLIVADATNSGQPTLPGMGSGEVKELISILRCRSFPGTISLRGPLPEGVTFREYARAFWVLLDTM